VEFSEGTGHRSVDRDQHFWLECLDEVFDVIREDVSAGVALDESSTGFLYPLL